MAVITFARVFWVLRKGRFAVALFWIAATAACVYPAMAFGKATKDSFLAPDGTDAADARHALDKAFPSSSDSNTLPILVERTNGKPVLTEWTRKFVEELTTKIVPGSKPKAGKVQAVLSHYAGAEYMLLPNVTNDAGTMTLVAISYTKWDGEDDWAADVRDDVDDYVRSTPEGRSGEYVVELTGQALMNVDSSIATEKDLETMESISMPFALLVIVCVLQSLPLMILPIISVLFTLGISYGIMYLVATNSLDVPSVCLSVMMSVTTAMSFDYSLFILSRYREEIRRKRAELGEQPAEGPFYKPRMLSAEDNAECVAEALKNAGKIVATSGFVLLLCFISMIFFPLSFMQAFGLSAAVALATTVLINLTLSPALLLILRPLFSLDGFIPGINFVAIARIVRDRLRNRVGPHSSGTEVQDVTTTTDDDPKAKAARRFDLRRAHGHCVTLLPVAIVLIIAIIGIFAPVMVATLWIKTTSDLTDMQAAGADSVEAYKHLCSAFPPGIISPYKILITKKSDSSPDIWSKELFESSAGCLKKLEKVGGVENTTISSIMLVRGMAISYDMAMALTNNQSQYYNTTEGESYRMLAAFLVNPTHDATTVMLPTSFDPNYNISGFIDATRDVLKTCEAGSDFMYYLIGVGTTDTKDAVDTVLALFPTVIGATAGVIAVLLLIVYRTAFLPIRALLMMGMTIGFSFGLGTVVFVLGWFDDLSDTLKKTTAFNWFVPIASFDIIIGLALDYDIFLYERIREMRMHGKTTPEAVAGGVQMTGYIIMCAGVIMALAFGGMMSSSNNSVMQIGFMLTVAVLFDTFIICSMFAPSVFRLTGEINWFPKKLALSKSARNPEGESHQEQSNGNTSSNIALKDVALEKGNCNDCKEEAPEVMAVVSIEEKAKEEDDGASAASAASAVPSTQTVENALVKPPSPNASSPSM
eukprot:m51a1_g1754 putative MmpL efflux pump (931) ;mRNA; f:230861-234139